MPRDVPAPLPCGLCDRSFVRTTLTKHHCLPKSKGGTADDVELICSQCHGMVHATYTNATLAAPQIITAGTVCQPAVFDGQRLAMR